MIEARLKELNLVLPAPAAPAATYRPFVKVGSLVFISGQLPFQEGKLSYVGKVGRDFTIAEGQEAARLCALNILSQLREACGGDLNQVVRCIRLGGFVHSVDDFKEHPRVMNGASDLIVSVFGERGQHARVAVGASTLPLGSAIEVEGLFEVKEG